MQIVQGFLPSKDVETRASVPLDGENKNEGVPRRRNWTAVEFTLILLFLPKEAFKSLELCDGCILFSAS